MLYASQDMTINKSLTITLYRYESSIILGSFLV